MGVISHGQGQRPLISLLLLKILLFADDIAILASSPEQLQLALNLMAVWAEKRGLRWGHAKCKVMRLCRVSSDKTTREQLAKKIKMRLQGHVLEWVSEFPYLGMHIAEAPEHKCRIPLYIPTKEHKIRGLSLHRPPQDVPHLSQVYPGRPSGCPPRSPPSYPC